MVRWNSSPHPISDIRDWSESGRLELRPSFQRREVWSAPARIMLMDTILRNVPMPKIYLSNSIREGKTYRVVIDGQQRISAILAFLRNQFLLENPYVGEERGKNFSELTKETQEHFLSYRIDFNEALNPSDEEVREVYMRVNKYTVPLTKQELRRADFPGDFLELAEDLAVNPYFDGAGLFSAANRRRYGDVEYVSELLAAMIAGIQDKKDFLDDFYVKYTKWARREMGAIRSRFEKTLDEFKCIFDHNLAISETRFRQKADFYSLFLAIDELVTDGCTIRNKEVQPLQEDLRILDENIRPESDIEICSEYAIKCVSQANSASSRRWRQRFLRVILDRTYRGGLPGEKEAHVFYRLEEGLGKGDSSGMCPAPVFECSICGEEIEGYFNDCVLAWERNESAKHISNSMWIHRRCVKDCTELVVLHRPSEQVFLATSSRGDDG